MPRKIPFHKPLSARAPGRTVQVQRRESSTQRGYTWRWRCYALRFLEEHPWCVHCEQENVEAAATEVDHIVPVTSPEDLWFWHPDNHQGLCSMHHKRKTVLEDGGFGRAKTPKRITCKARTS